MSDVFFGMAPIRKEGGAVHPDEMNPSITDEQYKRQFKAYIEVCRSIGVSEELIAGYRKHAVRNRLVDI